MVINFQPQFMQQGNVAPGMGGIFFYTSARTSGGEIPGGGAGGAGSSDKLRIFQLYDNALIAGILLKDLIRDGFKREVRPRGNE
jgi:hypothetical protein